MSLDTAQIRRESWEAVQGRITDLHARIWRCLSARGPATTKAISDRIGTDLLTVRPRVTELRQIGAVRLAGRSGREGVYAAVPWEDARAAWASTPAARQLDLL